MAKDKNNKKTEAAEGTAWPDVQPGIIWDDSNMRSVYANVTSVTGGREEIALLFGMKQTRHDDQMEVKVQLTDRITLSPFASKRLSILLKNVLRDYEKRYGSLQIEPLLQETPAIRMRPRSKMEITDQRASLIYELINDLHIRYIFERSFKMFERTLLGNRFLLSIRKNEIGQNSHEKILDICRRMDMPETYLKVFGENLSDVEVVHFGFEENKKDCIYKVYADFSAKLDRLTETDPPSFISLPNKSDSFLNFLGFKWDVLDNRKCALTKYTLYPSLSFEKILGRLSDILGSDKCKKTLEISKDFLDLVSGRITPGKINYFDVTEENSKRRSFDINIYDAELQLREIYPLLERIYQHYSIPADDFHALYHEISTKIFGHLSGGINREGKDFLTVYFGGGGHPVLKSLRPPFSKVGKRDEKGSLPLQLVEDLDVQYGFERSFKFFKNTLLGNRFLLGFRREAVRQKPHERILDICERMDMPEIFLKAFQENLPEANIVLFGFEEGERTRLYKAYLEFGGGFEKAIKENPDRLDPFLIHLGFKWDVSDNTRRAIARYTCFPSFSVENMMERLSSVFFGLKCRNPFEIAEGIVNLALNRVAHDDEFLYFEAEEEGNPRRSFDINMYRANLRLKELHSFLSKMCRHYAIPSEKFHSLYDPVKTQIFGHLSGGVDREGRDFLTVYFGEKGSTR